MLTNELISKLIDLQEQANTLVLKIQQMQTTNRKDRKVSRHRKRIEVLNSTIQRIIRRIAAVDSEQHPD